MPTLKSIYQRYTGDTATHQRTIAAALGHIDRRRQLWLARLVAGETYGSIADRAGVSRGAVQDGVTRALQVMRKRIAGEPRYSVPRGSAKVTTTAQRAPAKDGR